VHPGGGRTRCCFWISPSASDLLGVQRRLVPLVGIRPDVHRRLPADGAPLREEGATNVGFAWSPDGGYRDKAFASYPGDDYVDWVGMSLYNMNKDGTWCSPHNSGPGASWRTS
jgi:glycosyl hydrolase family 26